MNTLRVKAVADKVDVSVTTVWEWARDPEKKFPKPFKLSPTVTVWDEDDIDKWLEARKGECIETE